MNLFFSDKPGSHERHLRRKVNNPLFGDLVFSQQDVLDARAQDELEHKAFLESFHAIGRETATLDKTVEVDVLLELKQRLERSYEQSCYVMGHLEEIRQGLATLINSIMTRLLSTSRQDEAAMGKLMEEKAARDIHFGLLSYPLIADLIRNDSPIQPDDLMPSLLSDQEQVVMAASQMFTRQQLMFMCEHGERMLAGVKSHHERISHARDMLGLLQAVCDQQQDPQTGAGLVS